MKRPRRQWFFPLAFALWGCLPLYGILALLGGGAPTSAPVGALVGFTAMWWLTATGLALGQGWAETAAPILAAVPLTLGLSQWLRRLLFVAVHRGLEAGDGAGSPLAFLLGWTEETLFLVLPGLLLTGLGLAAWSRSDERDAPVGGAPGSVPGGDATARHPRRE